MTKKIIVGAVAVGGVVAAAMLIGNRPDKLWVCARAPQDGGTCIVTRADGGTKLAEPGRLYLNVLNDGRCEEMACP